MRNIYGVYFRDAQLYSYTGEWFCTETIEAFIIDFAQFFEQYQNISYNNGVLTFDLQENVVAKVKMENGVPVATVTDMANGASRLFHLGGGEQGGNTNVSPEKEETYQQALKDLQTVISGEYMVDYVDNEGVRHVINGSEAIEKLYGIFQSLGDYKDAKDYLANISVEKDRLVNAYTSGYQVNNLPNKVEYNSFGQVTSFREFDAILFGNSILSLYGQSGDVEEVIIGGSVRGKPVFDANGTLTGLWVTVNEKEYLASVSYSNLGLIVQVDIPVGYTLNHVSENPEDFEEVHKYIYGSRGELLQSTVIKDLKESKKGNSPVWDAYYYKHGFTNKFITEYRYDNTGKLTQELYHEYEVDYISGWDGWSYREISYGYDAAGKCTSSRWDIYGIRITYGEDREAYGCLFQKDGLVDSVANNVVQMWGEHLEAFDNSSLNTEYEYGDVYIYRNKN